MLEHSNIIITGATSGLGRELALKLADSGAHVQACGRRRERLDELEGAGRIIGHALDLSNSVDIDKFCAKFEALDGLILNAGITFADRFDAGNYQTDSALVDTNITANLQLIRALLPALKAKQGRILIIASLGGLTPVPYQSVYAGTKAFLVNFGLSLREELAPLGVKVSVFAPGGIATEMTDIPAMSHLKKNLAPVGDVADAALRAYANMPALSVPGAQNKLVAAASKFLPRGFMSKQAERIYKKD